MWLTVLCLIVLALTLLAYAPPRALLNWIASRNPDVLFTIEHRPLNPEDGKKVVALTIDDTPTKSTPLINEILAEHRCSATFFVIGDRAITCENGTAVLRDLVANGNELANHTMKDRNSACLSLRTLSDEIKSTSEMIATIHAPAKWFRPGSGFFHQSMIDIAKRHDLRTVLGSVYPHDPIVRWAWLNAYFIMKRVQDGDIIVIHDRPWTPNLLRLILPQLKARGFRVTTLSNTEAT